MLILEDLPEYLFIFTLLHFGVDKVWWWKLNKPFFQNRIPNELIVGEYILKYKKYHGCAYIVEVVKVDI